MVFSIKKLLFIGSVAFGIPYHIIAMESQSSKTIGSIKKTKANKKARTKAQQIYRDEKYQKISNDAQPSIEDNLLKSYVAADNIFWNITPSKNLCWDIISNKKKHTHATMGSTYHILGSIYEKENNDIAAMKMYETAAYAYENISSYFALANIYEKRKQISFAELFRKTGKNLKKQKKAEK